MWLHLAYRNELFIIFDTWAHFPTRKSKVKTSFGRVSFKLDV